MELIEIHMVCPQVFQGDFQILSEFLPSFCGCLGCDKHLVTYSLKGGSQLFLTVRIIPGCVKERDSAFIRLFYQVYGIFLRYSLDGKGPEPIFVHRYTCFPQSNFHHLMYLLQACCFLLFYHKTAAIYNRRTQTNIKLYAVLTPRSVYPAGWIYCW